MQNLELPSALLSNNLKPTAKIALQSIIGKIHLGFVGVTHAHMTFSSSTHAALRLVAGSRLLCAVQDFPERFALLLIFILCFYYLELNDADSTTQMCI